jgi:hypothetical protein
MCTARLAAVDEHLDAALMGDAADFLHVHHRAEHVRHVGDRHQLGAVGQRLAEIIKIEIALVVDADPDDLRALALAQEMPRHDVGVMLHDGDDDLVALADDAACHSHRRRY